MTVWVASANEACDTSTNADETATESMLFFMMNLRINTAKKNYGGQCRYGFEKVSRAERAENDCPTVVSRLSL